ncbi:PAS domain S-box protein, partial [Verrucomicrobiota bacterium]
QVYLKDTDSRFVSVNLVTARFFGAASPDEIIDKCDLDFFPRELAAQFLAEEQAVLRRDQPCVNREVAITDSEGNARWIWTTKVPMRDYAGKITGLLGIGRDITEQKQLEERARLARETLELVNRSEDSRDVIHDILGAIKKSTGFEAVAIRLRENDDFPYYLTKGFPETFVIAERFLCARDQTGKSVRDGKGNAVLECMCGNILCGRTNPALPFFTEGGSFWSNCTTQLLATTTEVDRQTRTRNRCNSEGYESVALIPLRADGEIIGLLQLNDHRRNQFTPEMIRFFEGLGATVGVALFRKRTDEALRASEERFRLIFENSNDGILVADATTRRFLFGNQGICRMLGYTPGELMKLGVDEIHPQKDLPTVTKAFEKQARKEIELATLPVQRKDGSVFYADVKAFPLELEGRTCLVGVFRDITERKQAEQKLKEYEEHLEELVGLRTAELKDANERLDAHDKARSEFVSVLTHELKVPLTSMGFEIANVLKGVIGPVPDRVTEHLQMLNTDCHRMTSTVQDVLDLSRLESKTMRLNQAKLLFERVIRRAATALRSQAQAKNLEMILSTAPGLGFVECDAFKTERVIINIIDNAIKFTPDGGRVEIGLQREATTPGALVLEVTGQRQLYVPLNDNYTSLFFLFFPPPIYGAYCSVTGSEASGGGSADASVKRCALQRLVRASMTVVSSA